MKGIFVDAVQSICHINVLLVQWIWALCFNTWTTYFISFSIKAFVFMSWSSISMPLEYVKSVDSTHKGRYRTKRLNFAVQGSQCPTPTVSQILTWCVEVLVDKWSDLSVHTLIIKYYVNMFVLTLTMFIL